MLEVRRGGVEGGVGDVETKSSDVEGGGCALDANGSVRQVMAKRVFRRFQA
jgi:hypothetical protein